MKPLYISFFLLLFSSTVFSQGFEWNEEINQKVKTSIPEIDFSKTRSYLPSSSSLERYLPEFVHNQGATGMCVAYSLANCRTIIYAKNKRISDKAKILANSFSPFFIYYQTKKSADYKCNQGLSPVDAILYLRDNGVAQLKDVEYPDYWPFTDKQLCTYYPPSYSGDKSNAYKYKIDEPQIVKSEASNNTKISALKDAISSGKPVFIGMDPFPKSLWASFGKDFWKPSVSVPCIAKESNGYECGVNVQYDAYCSQHKYLGSGSSLGHAMTIIAYDDYKYGGAFQILNSYGKSWGNDGKIWIRYTDVLDYTVMFVPISRKYEESSFGAPMSKNVFSEEDSIQQLASPDFINLDLEPPFSEAILD